MRHIPAVPVLALILAVAATPPASADPRMETNNNFCHFILDPAHTDNEVFVAGCDSSIVTVEPQASTAKGAECLNLVARGYGEREVVVPQALARMPAGSSITITSEDSDAACTMVESNGRAYRSHRWKSTISVEPGVRPGEVRVRYTLLCFGGKH